MTTTNILESFKTKKGQIAVLIDPDKVQDEIKLLELTEKRVLPM